jgi:hypothetical protein
MVAHIRAMYKNGTLRLLDAVGLSAGPIWMSDDFDGPLPDELWLGEDATS